MHKRGLAVTLTAFTIVLSTPVLASTPQCGSASWYELSSRTASGEMMNPDAMTAAHRSLPFGTRVEVINQANGKAVTLRINDRGPFAKGRIIDVSRAAAMQLGFKRAGHVKVCLQQAS